MNPNADKRTRLVEAADSLFHKQGVSTTTLAHIAALADVPLGNVYYYFKSKESIILAVLNKRRQLVQNQLNDWNLITDVKERLLAFINQTATLTDENLNYGDALGCLCQELSKQGGELATAASSVLQEVVDWCEKQFSALGQGEKSYSYAINTVSSLQGISLLILTLKNTDVINQQINFLKNWLSNI